MLLRQCIAQTMQRVHACTLLSGVRLLRHGMWQVMEGWRLLLPGMGNAARLDIQDVRIHTWDRSAFVTCVEIIEQGDARGRCADVH